MANRRLISAALALAAGSVMVALPSTAGATATPAKVPQYIVDFDAIALPVSTGGLAFHSTSCAIGPALDPIVVQCNETGTIEFTAKGGSGTATVTSPLSTISWEFKLHRTSATSTVPISTVYRMVGKGTESQGSTPIVRPVKVKGLITLVATPDPTFHGTEDVYPRPTPVS